MCYKPASIVFRSQYLLTVATVHLSCLTSSEIRVLLLSILVQEKLNLTPVLLNELFFPGFLSLAPGTMWSSFVCGIARKSDTYQDCPIPAVMISNKN
jgi:hypothetical protein